MRAGAVEKHRRVGAVGVARAVAIALPFKQPERHQRIEEILQAPAIERQRPGKLLAGRGLLPERCEELELDGAQQHLRGEEAHADLEDL